MESLELSGSVTVYVGNLHFKNKWGKYVFMCIHLYILTQIFFQTAELTDAGMLISKPKVVLTENDMSGYKCSL